MTGAAMTAAMTGVMTAVGMTDVMTGAAMTGAMTAAAMTGGSLTDGIIALTDETPIGMIVIAVPP